jgi:single-strand DNA-binding protein
MNTCIFVGRLGKDPETRATQSGTTVCNLSIAVSERFKNREGEYEEKTEWVTGVIFGPLAQSIADKGWLAKGDLVGVTTKYRLRKWTDNEGRERYTAEFVVDKLDKLGKGKGGDRDEDRGEDGYDRGRGSYGGSGRSTNRSTGNGGGRGRDIPDLDDDIPF